MGRPGIFKTVFKMEKKGNFDACCRSGHFETTISRFVRWLGGKVE
jgi:hypothetical protein